MTRSFAARLFATHLSVGLGIAALVATGAGVASCSPATDRNNGGGDDNNNGGGDVADMSIGEYDLEYHIDPGGNPDPDKPCSEQKFVPQKTGDPDIILIMDKSGSMSDGTPSKWDQTSKAITDVVTQLENMMSPIQWGLIMFPSDQDCGVQNMLHVPVAAQNGQKVIGVINANGPGGNTPLAKAVQLATTYYDSLKDGRGHYILVATDGEPNCDPGAPLFPQTCMTNAQCPAGQICQMVPLLGGLCTDPTGGAAVKAITAARMKGIRTYVVGISLSGSSATLDQMAVEGGTARQGSPKYYPVTDQNSIEKALTSITAQLISCSFSLKTLPMQNQDIVVTVGGATISRDMMHANGWDYDAKTSTLTFYGAACTSLQANPAAVSVGYTCPPPGVSAPQPGL